MAVDSARRPVGQKKRHDDHHRRLHGVHIFEWIGLGCVVFRRFQFIARIFLIGEWATSMVYASEEYPSDRRGTVIGVLQAFSSLGAIFCAGVTPFLLSTAYGWRTVYLVGVLPLVILAFARRNLKETQRFIDMKASGKQSSGDFRHP